MLLGSLAVSGATLPGCPLQGEETPTHTHTGPAAQGKEGFEPQPCRYLDLSLTRWTPGSVKSNWLYRFILNQQTQVAAPRPAGLDSQAREARREPGRDGRASKRGATPRGLVGRDGAVP